MKSTITILLSVIIADFLFVSCADNVNHSAPTGITENDIVGTWKLTGVTTDTIETPEDIIPNYRLEFADEGVGIQYYQGLATPFEWSLINNQINSSIWVYAGVVTDNTITYTFGEEDYTITQVFTKQY
ncbi:hypothetical protein K9N50_00640 [bacterium]|nr:hypothetical protein [bacterium]